MKLLTASLVTLAMLVAAGSAAAESKPLEISGYYKNLSIFTESLVTGEDIYAAINRLRVELFKEVNPWSFQIALDNELIGNDFANTPDFAAIRSREQQNTSVWDGDKTSVDNDHVYLRHAVYRAFAKYYSPDFQVTVGKQGIDWGVMRFYSPNDIFNTVGPIDLERNERVGVDAINANFALGSLSGVNAVVVPSDDDEEFMAAVKVYRTIKTYDVTLITAIIREQVIAGITFDGYIKSAGFRGEINHNHQDDGRNFLRASVGVDYSFSNKTYVLIEQLFNGGVDKNAAATFLTDFKANRRLLSLEKNLTSLWLQYKITPIVELNQYVIYDWDGNSAVYNPELSYNLTENTDITAGVQINFGDNGSEFGDTPDLYYAQFQLFF
ncbi:MAG: hypothetical protein KC900_12665 [Candidatus Omnitrophica bacterium]|nr:hypothetical protein [Candidatus Omnitrophota bacterium]